MERQKRDKRVEEKRRVRGRKQQRMNGWMDEWTNVGTSQLTCHILLKSSTSCASTTEVVNSGRP